MEIGPLEAISGMGFGCKIYLRLHLLKNLWDGMRSISDYTYSKSWSIAKNLVILRLAEHKPVSKHQRACGQLWPHRPGFQFHANLGVCFHSHFHSYCSTRFVLHSNFSTFTQILQDFFSHFQANGSDCKTIFHFHLRMEYRNIEVIRFECWIKKIGEYIISRKISGS